MPPFINFLPIVRYLHMILLYLKRLRRIRAQNNHEDETNDLIIVVNLTNIFVNWLRLIMLYMTLKLRRRKRELFKPHLMLQYLPGFRLNFNPRDVWSRLQNNWIYFYWLTGETPQTLSIIVRKLQNNIWHFNNLGRNSALDLRNQVKKFNMTTVY